MINNQDQRILEHLTFLYGSARGTSCFVRLKALLEQFAQRPRVPSIDPTYRFSERDVMLITYGDQVRDPDRSPLQSLRDMLNRYLHDIISGVHILPFYPYSSDDGFSVIDPYAINPDLGNWNDVSALASEYRVMFDLLVNHLSSRSAWFQAFLRNELPYRDYFLTVEPGTDVSGVTRPRALPLLTRVQTAGGERLVWTTFSADQIDLNYQNEDVLLAMIEIILYYVSHGASLLRLDAVGYLWKRLGTSCINLPETHRAVQLFRSVLDAVAPEVLIVTETNVPHQDNIGYFGDGYNEAQMVYQFSLAPLVLNAFYAGSAQHISRWAAELRPISPQATFFNFLACHDGIGVMPALGILGASEIDELVRQTVLHGGQVSYKNNPDGTRSPYELNITYFDALSSPFRRDEPLARQVDRYLSAHAIMLALAGVPGIYAHSLIGARNDYEGVARTGRLRSINRHKWTRDELASLMDDEHGQPRQVFTRLSKLIRIRRSQRAFHPAAPQQILALDDGLFVVLRTTQDGSERVLCIQSVSLSTRQLTLDLAALGFEKPPHDLVGEHDVALDGTLLTLSVAPYQVLWLKEAHA